MQHVLPPREFGTGASSKLGEDVFVCEYQYDEAWQVSEHKGLKQCNKCVARGQRMRPL